MQVAVRSSRTKLRQKRSTPNPLVQLRKTLGNGAKKLSTRQLAVYSGIPLGTIHSIEAGLRPISEEVFKKLRRHGMEWLPKAKRWVFTYGHDLPLNHHLLESY